MNEFVTAALIFTAVAIVFIALSIPLLRGRVRPNPWYGCRTEKTLSDEKVWYAVNRVTGRVLVAAGIAVVVCSLAFLMTRLGAYLDVRNGYDQMTLEIAFVPALLADAVVLFATEKLPVDLVALMVMSALLVSGVFSPSEGIAGFRNPATVTVGAMFILSAGLSKTGALNFAGAGLVRLGRRSFWLALASMMLFVGSVSAFVNNTAAVAVFMPVMLTLARDIGVSPSKLLMPLSFASMFGGICTLLGTSTNILVSSIAANQTSHFTEVKRSATLSLRGLVLFTRLVLGIFAWNTR
jgi:di/tricarboxylate transporter